MKRILLAALLATAWLIPAVPAAMASPVPITTSAVSYILLANASKTGDVVPNVVGGSYQVDLEGTVGGATVTIQVAGADGTLRTLGTYTASGIDAAILTIPAGASVRAVVTGGAPSGLYLRLGGLGGSATSGNGGGGAITAASGAFAAGALSAGSIASGAMVSGADVTEGTTAGAHNCAGTYTIHDCLGQLDDDVKGPGAVAGVTASGATLTEAPIANGCRAATASPTAVTDGQKVNMMCGPEGRIITGYSPRDLQVTGTASGTDTNPHTIIASAGGSLKNYITDLECHRDDAGTTMIDVTFSDAVSTKFGIPAGGEFMKTFNTPLATAAATAFTFTSATGTTTVYCSAQGFKGL
jgi:hypothetical protein